MIQNLNPNIFRAYDIRGKYPKEINEKIIAETIQCLKFFFLPNTKIVVGCDCRLSSPVLHKTVLNSLKNKNIKIKVVPVGLITTPMLSFLVAKLKANYGIMITASHNPKEYNGLKIIDENAIPISGQEILKIISKK